ncbi:unnamed protein product, partial [Symbiodinium natans]
MGERMVTAPGLCLTERCPVLPSKGLSKPMPCSRRVRRGKTPHVLPLPLLPAWPAAVAMKPDWASAAMSIANFCIVSLNALWADLKLSQLSSARFAAATSPQMEAHLHIATKIARMLERFASAANGSWSWSGGFDKFEHSATTKTEPLSGQAVDLLVRAGTCDPVKYVSPELAQLLSGANIFPEVKQNVPWEDCPCPGNIQEYAILVARELACGKVRLRQQAMEDCRSCTASAAELCLVATDDTVFIHRDKDQDLATLAQFDNALQQAGVPKKASKDVTLAEQITALGRNLKLLTCVTATLDVLEKKKASP